MAKINRSNFIGVLEKVRPGLAAKEIIQQATDVILGGGEVSTFNDFVLVSCLFETGITGAVRGKELHDILKRMPDAEVSLEATQEGLLIKGAKSRACVAMDPEVTLPLPDLAALDGDAGWAALPTGFLAAVKSCLFSASGDFSRGVLTCVHVGGGVVESCDNFRATQILLDCVGLPELLIPAKAAADLVGYGAKEVRLEDAWLYFRTSDGVIFACRGMAGEWPDIGGPFAVEGEALAVPDGFLDVVERAGVLAQADFDADRRMEVWVTRKEIRVRGEGPAGWYEEECSAGEYRGADLHFIVHPGDFADILKLAHQMTVGEGWLKFTGDGFEHVVCLVADDDKGRGAGE